MDFEREAGVFADSRFAAEIGDARQPFAGDARLDGINARRRQLLVFDIDIGRGETELATEAAAFDDGAENGVGAAEKSRRTGKIATRDRFTDERAADDEAVDFQRRHAVHGEIVPTSHFHEQVDVTFAIVAEIPGVAHGDAAQRPRRLNDLLDELTGGRLGRLRGEWTRQQKPDASLGQHELLMTRPTEQFRC